MKHKNQLSMMFLIFAIIGAIFAVIGGMLLKSALDFKRIALKTEATITNIETYRDSDGDAHHTVYVQFSIDDRTYTGTLNSYHTGMYVGGTTTVYYNPENPRDFRSSSDTLGSVIFLSLGILFAAIGFGGILNGISKTNTKRKLMANGERIYANFDGVEINYSICVNGRYPFVIYCQGNLLNGEYAEFKSENIWYNPSRVIEERNIRTFPVYIAPENPNKYYVSLEEINEFIKQE